MQVSAAELTTGPFPDRVGKYELLLPIGTGATATVFLARTRGVAGFEREVALKLVHAHLRADEESKLHLLDEARLAARIRHPNVVPVTEVESDPFGVFLVMDYVEGETLSGLVRVLREKNQRFPPRLAARIVNDALAGLHAAHELRDNEGQLVGLVHRDFSPQNILVGIEGVTRLADFGVAKAASRAVRTKTGLVKGKIAYMSPEQARGHRLDRRCDVWAAGVVVWELITGRRLYEHEDEVATLLSIVTQEPPRLREVIRGVPSAIEEAVTYALTSDLNNRCPSAEALRSLLEAAWQEIGGMASTSEVAAFVRATVGDKLSERRALAARRQQPAPPVSDVAPRPLLLSAGPAAPPAALPRDEATKTAISAAVPAAPAPSVPEVRSPFWRKRPFVVGAVAATVAFGTVALQLAPSGGEAPALEATDMSASGPNVRAAATNTASDVVGAVEPAGAAGLESTSTAAIGANDAAAKRKAGAAEPSRSPAATSATTASDDPGAASDGEASERDPTKEGRTAQRGSERSKASTKRTETTRRAKRTRPKRSASPEPAAPRAEPERATPKPAVAAPTRLAPSPYQEE